MINRIDCESDGEYIAKLVNENATLRRELEEAREKYTDENGDVFYPMTAKEYADVFKALKADARERESVLAATQCLHDMRGDDYGNALCPLEADRSSLLAVLRQAVGESGHAYWCGAIKGLEDETWTVEADCTCWVAAAKAKLEEV
jgi:hypothetical protein